MSIDLREFLIEFHDYLAPKLDVYEQAIYLYLVRHSRLLDRQEVTIGFKSARVRLATGIGENGKPMSESTSYKKLDSLQSKRCVTLLRTSHKGRVLLVHLPNEIEGLISSPVEVLPQDLESMDFFNVPENRKLLLERENHRCFYTLKPLTADSFVVEHIVSRPVGDNSYRNCVAASREANNKKDASSAEDFLRRLFREGFLNEAEFAERLQTLELVKSGHLKPSLTDPRRIS
jgi:5-methylcytosine-specific restriction endonuclease McrA